MGTSMGQVMTLANSIIGVSVLAMPFCYKQCGIVLSTVLLLLSSVLSRIACHFLLKAALITRRRNYEFLAFHVFGSTGKLAVELCIIGFLLGTCIAFFVVMGDLGPAILSSLLGIQQTDTLRTTILIGMALLVVLPLGLLRNVDSLSSVCAATVAFYLCLVLKVMGEATIPLMSGDWMEQVHFWRPEGILQCLPIFSMALFCQTQLFEIFDTVPNAALDKMNAAIRLAVNMCTAVYICVGFFGYVAFSDENITGNILMSLSQTLSSEVIKLGFVLSVAVSFPLVIFPCRASLYSLLYRSAQPPMHDLAASHVPENRFKFLTVGIVCVSLVLGLLLPNIETVLGLVGSTIGITVCITFPALLLGNTARHQKDRLVAQAVFWIGVIIMFVGTYALLLNSSSGSPEIDRPDLMKQGADRVLENPVDHLRELPARIAVIKSLNEKQVGKPVSEAPGEKQMQFHAELSQNKDKSNSPSHVETVVSGEKRQEPPVPVEPVNKPVSVKPVDSVVAVPESDSNNAPQMEKNANTIKEGETIEHKNEGPKEESLRAPEQVHQDAIRHEDRESALEDKKNKEKAVEMRDEKADESKKLAEEQKKKAEEQKLVEILQKHQKEQRNLLNEQQKILQELKKHEKLQQEDKQNANEVIKSRLPHEQGNDVEKQGLSQFSNVVPIKRSQPAEPNSEIGKENLLNTLSEKLSFQEKRQEQPSHLNQSVGETKQVKNGHGQAAEIAGGPSQMSHFKGAASPPDYSLQKPSVGKPAAAMPLPLYRNKASSVSASRSTGPKAAARDILESNPESLKHEDREKRDVDAVKIADQKAENARFENASFVKKEGVRGDSIVDVSDTKPSLGHPSKPQETKELLVSHEPLTIAEAAEVRGEDKHCDKTLKDKPIVSQHAPLVESIRYKSQNSLHVIGEKVMNANLEGSRTLGSTSVSSGSRDVHSLSPAASIGDQKVPVMELKTPSSISEPQLELHSKFGNGLRMPSGIALPTKRDLRSVNKH